MFGCDCRHGDKLHERTTPGHSLFGYVSAFGQIVDRASQGMVIDELLIGAWAFFKAALGEAMRGMPREERRRRPRPGPSSESWKWL